MNKYLIIRKRVVEEHIEIDASDIDSAVRNITSGILISEIKRDGEIVSIWKQALIPLSRK